MPKKPASNAFLINPFQELITLILTSLKAKGESVLSAVQNPSEGRPKKKRDVDVLLITFEDGDRIRVAYEAKDEKRRVGIGRVEEYLGKYFSAKGRVPVERLVMVSRKGFTKDAKTKAWENGVKTLTLDEAKKYDWARTGWNKARQFSKIKSLKVDFPPHLDKIEVFPKLQSPLVEQQVLRQGCITTPGCGPTCRHGTLLQFIHRIFLREPDETIAAAIEDMKQRAKSDPNGARLTAGYIPPEPLFVLRGVDLFPIERIEVELHVVDGVAPATCTSYTLTSQEDGSEQNFHHIQAKLGNFEFQFVLKHGEGPTNIGYKAKNHFVEKPKPKAAKPQKNARERAADRKKKNKKKNKKKK